jgi:hypothetical protein
MKKHLMMAAFVLTASAALAQNNPLSNELREQYARMKNDVTKAAQDMPDAGYSFVPAEGSRSYLKAVAHIADFQTGMCANAKGEQKRGDAESKTDKASMMASLKESFDYCDTVFADMTDAKALEMIKFFNQDRTRHNTLNAVVIHGNEMYGTLAVYLRLQHTVPPSTAARQSRAKEKK